MRSILGEAFLELLGLVIWLLRKGVGNANKKLVLISYFLQLSGREIPSLIFKAAHLSQNGDSSTAPPSGQKWQPV